MVGDHAIVSALDKELTVARAAEEPILQISLPFARILAFVRPNINGRELPAGLSKSKCSYLHWAARDYRFGLACALKLKTRAYRTRPETYLSVCVAGWLAGWLLCLQSVRARSSSGSTWLLMDLAAARASATLSAIKWRLVARSRADLCAETPGARRSAARRRRALFKRAEPADLRRAGRKLARRHSRPEQTRPGRARAKHYRLAWCQLLRRQVRRAGERARRLGSVTLGAAAAAAALAAAMLEPINLPVDLYFSAKRKLMSSAHKVAD